MNVSRETGSTDIRTERTWSAPCPTSPKRIQEMLPSFQKRNLVRAEEFENELKRFLPAVTAAAVAQGDPPMLLAFSQDRG